MLDIQEIKLNILTFISLNWESGATSFRIPVNVTPEDYKRFYSYDYKDFMGFDFKIELGEADQMALKALERQLNSLFPDYKIKLSTELDVMPILVDIQYDYALDNKILREHILYENPPYNLVQRDKRKYCQYEGSYIVVSFKD